jgi:hypothetical protein
LGRRLGGWNSWGWGGWWPAYGWGWGVGWPGWGWPSWGWGGWWPAYGWDWWPGFGLGLATVASISALDNAAWGLDYPYSGYGYDYPYSGYGYPAYNAVYPVYGVPIW